MKIKTMIERDRFPQGAVLHVYTSVWFCLIMVK